MSHRQYASLFLALLLLWVGGLLSLAYSLQPLVGDLTRIGRLDEADFGPNEPELRFDPALFALDPAQLQHDIVVVGDSFSQNLDAGWQNYVAAETGARIATFRSDTHSPESVMADARYLAHPPKILIWELVERNLVQEAVRQAPCEVVATSPSVKLSTVPYAPKTYSHPRPKRAPLSASSMSYALDFSFESLRRRVGLGSRLVPIRTLRRRMFTSRLGDQLLSFGEEIKKELWTPDDLQHVSCGMRKVQAAAQHSGNTLFLMLVVPDKSSAYVSEMQDQSLARLRILDRLDVAGVNYIAAASGLEAAIRSGVLDIYKPNDTHLGSKGHRLVADAVLTELRRRAVVPSTAPGG